MAKKKMKKWVKWLIIIGVIAVALFIFGQFFLCELVNCDLKWGI